MATGCSRHAAQSIAHLKLMMWSCDTLHVILCLTANRSCHYNMTDLCK